MREHITGRDNPLVKLAVKLAASRTARREAGLYLCDGPTLLPEALAKGAQVTAVLCAEGMALPALPEGVRIAELPERLLRAVSPTETPQGLVFLTKLPDAAPPVRPADGRFVLLDRVQDPGNVGSILRTASAFSVSGVILGPGCADPFSPKAVRAAMGAAFGLPVFETPDPLEALKDCKLPVYAAALSHDAIDIRGADLSSCVLLLGNEGAGLSDELLNRADARIKIPMAAECQSLGVAVAAAVLLYNAEFGMRNAELGTRSERIR